MADAQNNLSLETWKEIPGFPGYEVSDQGRVRSFKGRAPGGYKAVGWELKETPQRMLKPSSNRGYLRVGLTVNGQTVCILLHKLVLTVFVGPCPPGMEGCHNDGNRANNFLTNLRWDTKINNWKDRYKHKTVTMGEKNGKSKLTKKQVCLIKKMLSEGVSQDEVAKKFSISQHAVSCIKCRRTWAHIP